MDFEVKEGTDIDRILKALNRTFPEYMKLQDLKKELDETGVISESELEKYLVYLEDKNWVRKQGNKFRITAQGIDVKEKVTKSKGGFEVWEL